MTKPKRDGKGWSRGLSAATDHRVARMTEAMRAAMTDRTPWALGKSAATSRSIARGVSKRRGVRRGPYGPYRNVLLANAASGPPPTIAPEQVDAYAYMLGMYFGDGYLALIPRYCRLVVALDDRYPDVIQRVASAMRTLQPGRKVRVEHERDAASVRVISNGWRWLALFPHHGRGRKHLRRITLRAWQRELIARSPIEFVRGLVDSDGCRSVRRQDGKAYPFYSFNNESEDILGFFRWACDLLEVHYTRPRRNCISVARRSDVEFLDRVLGPKT